MGELGAVRRWQLWQLPRRVLTLVMAVHVVTVSSVLSTAWLFPIERRHWIFAALLVALGTVHLELSRGIGPPAAADRVGPYHDLKTVWNAAALLLLPPVLATAVIVCTHAYGYVRIHRDGERRPHRWVYTCATVVLASQAAAVVLAVGTDTYPGVPGPARLDAWLVVFAAVLLRWLVNYLLVVTAGVLSCPRQSFTAVFTRLGEQVNEAAGTALAIVVAVLLAHGYPVLLLCVYLVVAVLQQTSHYHHWKRERSFDPLTGAYSRQSFVEQAKKVLAQAKARGGNVGCLLLDLDLFKRINDTHGHNVGDRALVAVAAAIKEEVRAGKDIPARWGGEEFVVLVPDVTRDTLTAIAERIRRRVAATKVTYRRWDPVSGVDSTHTVGMTVSIGAALFPDAVRGTADENLLDLIERADQLMYAAKAAGRDQVRATRDLHVVRIRQSSTGQHA